MKVFAVDGTLNINTMTQDMIAVDIRTRAGDGDIAFLFDTHTYGEFPALQAEQIFVGSGGGVWVEAAIVRASELGAQDVFLYGDGFWLGKDADVRGMNVQHVVVGAGPHVLDFPVAGYIP
jgi:hypothetical protein